MNTIRVNAKKRVRKPITQKMLDEAIAKGQERFEKFPVSNVSYDSKNDKLVFTMKNGATRELKTLNGKKVIIDVFLTKGQVFNSGEKVKIDMKYVGWGGSSINWNTTDNIEKVYEVKSNVENNADVWIWS